MCAKRNANGRVIDDSVWVADVPDEYVVFARRGFRPCGSDERKNVAIIGAGMAGLTAALMLQSAGHRVTIYEASQRQRVGGRIRTLRNQDFHESGTQKLKDTSLYCEAGAMRFPTHHRLVQALIKRFKLKTTPFINVDTKRNGLVYLNGTKFHRWEIDRNISLLRYRLNGSESQFTTDQMVESAFAGIRAAVAKDPSSRATWRNVIKKFDRVSLYELLRGPQSSPRWSENAVELIGLLENLESQFTASCLQIFVDMLMHHGPRKKPSPMVSIVGGNDQLPKLMADELESNGASVQCGYDLASLKNIGGDSIEMTFRRRKRTVLVSKVILTIPFSHLRFVSAPELSREKRSVIRQLYYDVGHKIFLEFSECIWEKGSRPIKGGQTVTDLPIRVMYYPSPIPGRKHKGGLLLASYCWGDDARRWDSLTTEQAIDLALDYVAMIHPKARDYFTGAGISHSWARTAFAGGMAAQYLPGQLQWLHREHPSVIQQREGGIYFAGEHTSFKHAWVEGAIESGIRVAAEVDGRSLRSLLPTQVRGRRTRSQTANRRPRPAQRRRRKN
jgi:monoamine oxidase